MMTTQGLGATPPPARKRPELDLGPMTGDAEYIRQRAENLIRAYAGLLDVKEIKLVDSFPEGGKTDCSSTIWAPLQDPEGYLVTEHELSHWLFETDVVMAQKFVEKLASKLLNAAGAALGTNEALPYEKHLFKVIHHLWNIVEDWRCCWAWSQIYRGGGALLQQRWHDISEHDMSLETKKVNLLAFLGAYAAGVETPEAPQNFQDCRRPMRRALNLVEGVDGVACLAIVSRLVEEISDALVANNPPPPQGGGSGPAQQREERKQQALHLLKLLLSMVPRTGPHAPSDGESKGEIGGNVPRPKPGSQGEKAERKQHRQMIAIDKLLSADDKETDESGTTPFGLIMAQGADDLQDRLEEARRAMMRRQDTPDESNAVTHLGWSQEVGIPIRHVTPTRELPGPTQVGYENRRILEQLRMQKRRKRDFEGDFNSDRFLGALGAGELDRPFYDKTVRVAKFELLFLFDVSGSMTMGQALPLTERALADSIFAVQAIRSKAFMWGFSDALYIFDKVGGPTTSGIRYGSTCTVQALDVAHKWGAKAPTKRAVMLVTDGWPTSVRARNSTGNPLTDLHAVLSEMRADKIPLSTLAIRHTSTTVEQATIQYNTAFGVGGYGMVSSFDEVAVELPKAIRILAAAHIQKGLART
jgi:hypothetical protein